MFDVQRHTATLLRPPLIHEHCPTECAACGASCLRDCEQLVGFCDDCLETVDPRTYDAYPDGWVMLGGGD